MTEKIYDQREDLYKLRINGTADDLPPLGEELYEFYHMMSAQSHEAAVKEYARKAIKASKKGKRA